MNEASMIKIQEVESDKQNSIYISKIVKALAQNFPLTSA